MSEIISASAALALTHKLQEALSHDIFFAQALVNTASLQEIESLRCVIKYCDDLRSNPMSSPLRRQHKNLKDTDRGMFKRTKPAIRAEVRRRVFKVKI